MAEEQTTQTTDQADQLGGNEQQTQPPAPEQTQPKPQEPSKSFTQEDVNGLVAKEAKKAQEKLLKQLGIEDFNSAKEGLAKFREYQESQKTESEKQAEQLATYQTKAEQAEERAKTLEAQLSALKANVNPDYLDDVLLLAKNKEADSIDEAIASVLERHPHFAAVQPETQTAQAPRFTSGQHKKDSGDSDAFVAALLGKK